MEETENRRYNNRMVLLLIAGLPLMMILSATWLWIYVVRGDLDLVGMLGTANRGVLVQPPRQIDDFVLTGPDGFVFRYADLEPRWTMVIPVSGGRCDRVCESNLYITRQIHIALGKEFNRVRRFYVSDAGVDDSQLLVQELSDERRAPASFAAYLADEHRGLTPLQLASGDMDALFAEYRLNSDTWYLVDPSGWVMMSYNDDISYKDVIADLKFLLKNSGE
jgi:hypothetical protein